MAIEVPKIDPTTKAILEPKTNAAISKKVADDITAGNTPVATALNAASVQAGITKGIVPPNLFNTASVTGVGFNAANILTNPLYRGFVLPVKPGEVYSFSRENTTNNRFRHAFTAAYPGSTTVPVVGYVSSDTATKVENVVVPAAVNYMVFYFSNQADPLPRIKIERGSTATQWVSSREDETVDPAAQWGGVLMQTYAQHDGRVNAHDRRFGAKGTKQSVINALDAAEAAGRGTVAYFPSGVYDLGTGLSMSGRTAQIQGAGVHQGSNGTDQFGGTTFYAPNQSGPVLDFKGWKSPYSFLGRAAVGGFHVRGSGAADPTKANTGIEFSALSSTTIHDISITGTGGPGFKGVQSTGNALYLCDVERVTVGTPIGAKLNDVPYIDLNEPNGTRFKGVGIRSLVASGDCGVSGAVVISSNETFSSGWSVWDSFWVEYLHIPTNGTIFSIEGNRHTVNDTILYDIVGEAGATNNSFFRIIKPVKGGADFGANAIRGFIPGKANNVATGVEVYQSGNTIEGVKGYNGANVTLASGVERTTVVLAGAESGATVPGVVDNSGKTSNTIIDNLSGIYKFGRAPATQPTLTIDGALLTRNTQTVTVESTTGPFSVNAASVKVATLFLRANATFDAVTGATNGAELVVKTRQAGNVVGSSWTMTWPANFRFAANTAPTLSTGVGDCDIFTFVYDSAFGVWQETARAQGVKIN